MKIDVAVIKHQNIKISSKLKPPRRNFFLEILKQVKVSECYVM